MEPYGNSNLSLIYIRFLQNCFKQLNETYRHQSRPFMLQNKLIFVQLALSGPELGPQLVNFSLIFGVWTEHCLLAYCWKTAKKCTMTHSDLNLHWYTFIIMPSAWPYSSRKSFFQFIILSDVFYFPMDKHQTCHCITKFCGTHLSETLCY